MGSGLSSAGAGPDSATTTATVLGDLPENCVAQVLLRLEPPEICGLARLSRTFRLAASADPLWEDKLPKNYKYLMEKSRSSEEWCSLSKKEIFAKLCSRNPFDGGAKEFWMEKRKGGTCVSISSKDLSITGIDDRRYWNYIPSDESRFQTIAYLNQIWWLEIRGEINFSFTEGTYSLYFRLHLGRPSRRLGRRVFLTDQVHGWTKKPVQFGLSTSDGQHTQAKCFLGEPGAWISYYVGDFEVRDFGKPVLVNFSMSQIDCTHTKGGLCVDSVLILPKGLVRKHRNGLSA
ncbi:hypothetical protein LUZ60_007191 [Juncus effusus]|nr:hypothetical protein LUZ60_007191 [Juncus effusus]